MNINQFSVSGLLNEVFDAQQVSEKFRKREFILEIPGQYPEHVKFQLVQEKCAIIDEFKPGDLIKVDFNLRGRVFMKDQVKSCFTNLEAWRIKLEEQAQVPALAQERSKPNSQL